MDFLGGPVVKNLPSNAGTHVQSLVWGHPTCCRAAKPCTTMKPEHPEPMLFSKRNHNN